MDTVDQEWNEFQKSLRALKKAPALRDQLNVISAQLNEIEQDTKEIPKIKQELTADQNANEQLQADMGAGVDPLALQQGMGMDPTMQQGGAPMPPDGMPPGENINKAAGDAEMPTEPLADAVNMDTGDDKVVALFNQLIQALSESAHGALDNGDIGRLMALTNMQSNLANMMKDLGPLVASVPQNDLGGGAPVAKASQGEAHEKTLREIVGDNYKGTYKLDRRSTTNLYKLYNKFLNSQRIYLNRSAFDPSDPAKLGSHTEIANAVRYADPDMYDYLIDKYHVKGRKPSIAEMIGADIMSEQKSRELGKPVVIQPAEVPDAVVHYINRKIMERTYPDMANPSSANSEVDYSTGSNRQAGVLNTSKYKRAKEVQDDEFAHFLPYTNTAPLSYDDFKTALRSRNAVRRANNQMWTKDNQPIIRGNSDEVKASDKNFEDVANRVNQQFYDWQNYARSVPKALRYLAHHPLKRDENGKILPIEELSTEGKPVYGYNLSELASGAYPVKIHEGNPDFDIIYRALQEDENGPVENYYYHDEIPEGVQAEPAYALPKNQSMATIMSLFDGKDYDLIDNDISDHVAYVSHFTPDQESIMREYLKKVTGPDGTSDAPEWYQFVEDFPTLSRIVRKYGDLEGGSKLDLDIVHALAKDRNPLYRKVKRNPLRYNQAMYNTGSSYVRDIIDPDAVMARTKKPSMSAEDLALSELGNYLSRNARNISPEVEVPMYVAPGHVGVPTGPIRSREDYAGYYTHDGEFSFDGIPSYPEYVKAVLGNALADPSKMEGGINPEEIRVKVPPKSEITTDETTPLPKAKARVVWDPDEMDAAEEYVKENINTPGAFRDSKKEARPKGSSDLTEDVRSGLGRGQKNKVLRKLNKNE